MKAFWQKASAERTQLSEKWFAERRNAIDQGWYSYVKDQRKGLLPADFSEKNYNIVIFNSTMEEQVGIPGRDPPIYRDELDGLARIAKSLDGTANIKVFIRMHPNLKGCENSQVKEIRKIVNRHSSLISLISSESTISSYALIDKCNLVVSMGSTIGVEACFWGKPVVLACRACYESLDCCYKPQTHEDLISTILSHPQPKSKESALPYAYWEATHGIPYEHFSPSGIFSGTFNGRNARKLPLYILFITFIMRLGEIRNFRDLTLTSLRPFQEIAKIFKQKKK